MSAGAVSGTSTKHSNLGDGTQRFDLGFRYLGKVRADAGMLPHLPTTQISPLPKNNFLTLKRWRVWQDRLGKSQEVRSPRKVPAVRHPAAGTWATLSRVTFQLSLFPPAPLTYARLPPTRQYLC